MFAKKILILGHKRHGKDTLAKVLCENNGISASSSSYAANKIFIYKTIKDDYGYNSLEECFNDRLNHRKLWYDMICDYNKDDKAKLAKDILFECDCYVGMRDVDELIACKKQDLFDIIVWVDAHRRLPLESTDSFNIKKSDADIIICNNTTEEDFIKKAKRFGDLIYK